MSAATTLPGWANASTFIPGNLSKSIAAQNNTDPSIPGWAKPSAYIPGNLSQSIASQNLNTNPYPATSDVSGAGPSMGNSNANRQPAAPAPRPTMPSILPPQPPAPPPSPAPSSGGYQNPQIPGLNGLIMPQNATPQSQYTASSGSLYTTLQQAMGLNGGLQGQVQNQANDTALNNYVDQATQGLKAAYEQDLAKQINELHSQYAAEGSYLSGPMFAAEGQLRANLTNNYLSNLAQLQLGAGESERNRQYQTVFLQSQNALKLADSFQQLAQTAQQSGATVQAAQWQAMADAYRTQAQYGASIFGTQSGLAGSVYGNQVQQYLGQLGNNLGQNQLGANTLLSLLGLQLQGQGQNFNQQLQLSQLSAANQQAALAAYLQQYLAPGQNALQVLQPFFGLNNVSKSNTSSGLGSLF